MDSFIPAGFVKPEEVEGYAQQRRREPRVSVTSNDGAIVLKLRFRRKSYFKIL